VEEKGDGLVLFLLVQEKNEKKDAPTAFLNGFFLHSFGEEGNSLTLRQPTSSPSFA
jgi:hypothetical protein